MSRPLWLYPLPCAVALACFLGCSGGDKKTGESGKTTEEHGHDHGHDHDHDHGHAHEGPHGGHLVELAEPGKENKEEYHAEWVHDESGKITVYVLDGAAKQTVPIAAESIKISVTSAAAKESQSYELPAQDRTSGDKPTAFKFELVSKELLGALETPKSTSPVIQIDVNGKAYEGKIEEHEEHDHGHKH